MVVGFALAVVLCFAGVAYAADGAVPGDTLYEFDCALEDVGIGDGGLQERLHEATQLAEQGESEQALTHAAEAVADHAGEDQGAGQANAALVGAANAVQATNQGESAQVRARVAEMLRWMATNQAAGPEFGQGVAERAHGISGAVNNPASEHTQNGELEQEQNQNGELDETQNQELEQNQNGELHKNQNGQHEYAGQ